MKRDERIQTLSASQSNHITPPPVIGNFCTCDVDNYGDLLYPIFLRHILTERKFTGDFRPYGFLDGPAPLEAGYYVNAVSDLLNGASAGVSALVIGGGDIIRTDKSVLASHYASIYRRRKQQSFWGRLRGRLFGEPDQKEDIARTFMAYRSIGPLILNAEDFSALGPVAYCSCGAPFEFEEQEKADVARAFNNAAFIYVRDHQSSDKLKRAGVTRRIEVAPDLIVTLSDFYDRETEADRGRGIMQAQGVDTARPVIGFQCTPQTGDAYAEIVSQLKQYRRRNGCEIALLPIGHCHGDCNALKRLAAEAKQEFRFLDLRSVGEMLSVIAACNIFLGTSMHANITAFSFGIPHLFGPLAVDKIEGFMEITGLDPASRLHGWSEIADKLQWAESKGAAYYEDRAASAKKAVYETFDLLVPALLSKERPAGDE